MDMCNRSPVGSETEAVYFFSLFLVGWLVGWLVRRRATLSSARQTEECCDDNGGFKKPMAWQTARGKERLRRLRLVLDGGR